MNSLRLPALVAAAALVLVACGRDEETAEVAAGANPLLDYVPADTPYVFANLEPLPADVVDAMLERAGPMLDEAQKLLGDVQIEVNVDEPDGDEKALGLIGALLDELDGKLNRAGLESLGIGLETHHAFYGNGAFPVMRAELLDAGRLRAAIERVQAKAGMDLPEYSSGTQKYWRLADDGETLGLYIAIVDRHLALAAFPVAAQAEVLPGFLGQEMPAESMAQSPALPALNAAKGFSDYGSGYIDVARLADEFFDPAARTAAWLGVISGYDPASLDAACVAEARLAAALAPRWVSGITSWTANEVGMRHQLELKPWLAGELAELVSDVPPAPSDPDAVLSVSLALEVGKLREFLLEKATRLADSPFACLQLEDLNLRIRTLATQLNQPMPPFIGNLKGFRAMLEAFDPADFQPENARGKISVEMESPQMVIGMASMMIPGFEDLGIEPGADPVQVPQELLSVVTPEVAVYAVMTKDAIGIAMGQGHADTLLEFMNASGDNRGTFLSVEYDLPALMDMHRRPAEADATADDPTAAMAEAYRNMVGRNRMDLRFTKEGLTVEQSQTFEP